MILLSRIIKSSQAKEQVGKTIKIRPFPVIHSEHEEQAAVIDETTLHELLEQAERQAEWLVQQANEQAATIKNEIEQARVYWEQEERPMYMEQAQKEGYQQGIEDGVQKGYRETAEAIAYAKEIVELSKQEYSKQIEAAEPVILELAMKVAGKIIGYELKENEEAFFSMVKRAIKEARENREVQLHIHPSQYPFILSHKEELEAIFPKNTDLYVYPNDELAESSCIIESESGRIDASIDSQLREMKDKLLELLEGES